ncbi:hypothetical protein LJB78_00400 [Bacteroidales bacterium OttesenSCG-928-J16]|nr:hypothetical protein [Bacteroidales bacterium OttesenSCG-928-J16]
MKNLFLSILFYLGIVCWAAAQQAEISSLKLPPQDAKSVDEIAEFINEQYDSEADKIRAIYSWIGENIAYDIEKAAANLNASNEKKAYDKEVNLTNTLRARKGVCQDYSELMEALCRKCGIKSYVVVGFVLRKGQENEEPHAWVVVQIDGAWKIYDPTWGAGYVNDNVFTKRLTFDYYEIIPSESIVERMPYDPMWQLLEHPVAIPDFYAGIYKGDAAAARFNFRDTIALHESQDQITQYHNVLRRIESGGIYNQSTVDQVNFIRNEIENDKIERFNRAVANYNEAVKQMNAYSHYFNTQFTPEKSRAVAENMISAAEENIRSGIEQFRSIENPSPAMQQEIGRLIKTMNELSEKAKTAATFVKKYYDTDVAERKELFYIRVPQ